MTNYLKQEDDSYLLQEDSSKLVLQEGSSPSQSVSASISPSSSISSSPSSSPSASTSPSPSAGYAIYTRGDEPTLPTNTNDLETFYTDAEELTVEHDDYTYIGQTGMGQYMIHQFKLFVAANMICTIEFIGKSTLAPSLSTVYLQVYNWSTGVWETKDSENAFPEDINFELSANLPDLTNYKDGSNVITCRTYQRAI